MKVILFFINVYFKVLSSLSPKAASRRAFHLFQKTSRTKMKPKEAKFYHSPNTFVVECTRGDVICYENGDPNGDFVLLVHGWNSNAGSMSGIGEALVERGYHVISFDLPAHGKTNSRRTNLVECKDVMLAVLHRVRSEKPISIVAHSFGTLVSVLALSTLERKFGQVILLASAGSARWIFDEFKNTIGLSEKANHLLVSAAEEILSEELDEISMIKKLKIAEVSSLELIHDVHDKVLPYQNSQEIAKELSVAQLHSVERVGHYRMLWNPVVLDTIVHALEARKHQPTIQKEEHANLEW